MANTPRSPHSRITLAMLLMTLAILLLNSCTGSESPSSELRGHITVSGSTALLPLSQKAATLYQKQHPGVKIDVKGGGSVTGLKEVTSHKVDIGNSDIYADPAVYPDPKLTDHIVCVVPFTMVVHPEVTIHSLTQQQIIDIFSTGNIRNWKEVGGPDLQIVPVVRPASSGTRATFRKYILGGLDEKGQFLKSDSSQDVRDAVANTPGAIGYLAISFLNPTVRSIAINTYQPTTENISAGRYTFWSYEHMYTLNDTDSVIASYLNFMLTPAAQNMSQELGYIPIASMKPPTVAETKWMSRHAPSIVYEREVNQR